MFGSWFGGCTTTASSSKPAAKRARTEVVAIAAKPLLGHQADENEEVVAADADSEDEEFSTCNWTTIGTLPKFIMYEVPSALRREMRQQPTTRYLDLLGALQEYDPFSMNASARKVKWFFAEYQVNDIDVKTKFALLHKSLNSGNHDAVRHLSLGVIGDAAALDLSSGVGLMALINKPDYSYLKPDAFVIDGHSPVAIYKPKFEGISKVKENTMKSIMSFSQCVSIFVSSMHMEHVNHCYSIDHMEDFTKHLSDKQLLRLKANIRLTPKDERTKLQSALLDGYHDLLLLRSKAMPTCIITFHQAKGSVQSEVQFINNWRSIQITLTDSSLLPDQDDPLTTTIGEYLDNPRLHQSVSLLVRGPSRTGKTELCKLICLMLALRYQDSSDAYFVFVTTLDILRQVQTMLLPGVPVLFDDVQPGDKDQLVHSSLSMWKQILQVKDNAQIRGRCDDIAFAKFQPKVVTTNSTSVSFWLGGLGIAGVEHIDAIKMRIAEVEITETLWASHGRAPAHAQSLAVVRTPAEVSNLLHTSLGNN